MNTTLSVMADSHPCVSVIINDDNIPEQDESFEVVFTELSPELAPACGSGYSSSGSGMMTMVSHSNMLMPMVSNETVTITILDNDFMEGEFPVCVSV